MDPISPLIALAANVSQIMQAGGQVSPLGRKKRRHASNREATYLRFQKAASDVGVALTYLPTLEKATQPAALQVFYTPALMRELSRVQVLFETFFSALLEIRIVGNPDLRLIAENIAGILGAAAGSIPVGRSQARAELQTAFDRRLKALAAQHREFTLAARKDLGYGPSRWRWLKRRRDTGDPWPGPDVDKLIEDANL